MPPSDAPAKPARFYERVTLAEVPEGWAIELDDRRAKTRARAALTAPTRPLAEAVASEWDAQGETIDAAAMPLTGLLMTALDLGPKETDIWRERIISFLSTDLLCYRAAQPAALVARQQETWDPVLSTLAQDVGVDLQVTAGVGHVAQDNAPSTPAGACWRRRQQEKSLRYGSCRRLRGRGWRFASGRSA